MKAINALSVCKNAIISLYMGKLLKLQNSFNLPGEVIGGILTERVQELTMNKIRELQSCFIPGRCGLGNFFVFQHNARNVLLQ